MKKIRWLAFIAIAFMGLLFMCCNNGFGNSATVKGDGITVKDTLEITVSAEENLEIFGNRNASNGNARTITSEAFALGTTEGEASTLVFYLWGEAQTGQKLAPRTVEVTNVDGVTGTVKLDIDCYNWNLTLAATLTAVADLAGTDAAYDADIGKIMDDAVLIGYANIDMMFTNHIQFTISPKGLTKKGNIALRIGREGNWPIPEGYKATAYLYDLTTGESIFKDANGNPVGTELYDGTTATPTDSFIDSSLADAAFKAESPNYTAQSNDVDPGIYLFQIEFVKEDELRKYVWNDTLIVLPGNTTAKIHDTGEDLTEKIIIPNLIGTKPEDVTSLDVDFVKKDSPAYDPEHDDEPGFYVAHFTWVADNTKTETNYAFEIIELNDEVLDTELVTTWDDAAWNKIYEDGDGTTDKTNAKYLFDHYHDVRQSHLYKLDTNSSLFANKTSLYLYLELGKRYVARIASENNAGLSENWTYVTLETGYKTINQYRITYHLQQGTWKEQGQEKIVDQLEYDGQHGTGHAIIVPNGDGTAGDGKKPKLYVNDQTLWYYWSLGVGGDPYSDNYSSPDAYTGYKNLDLYAVYSRDGAVIIQDDNDYDILKSYVSIDNKDNTTEEPAKGIRLTYSIGDQADTNAAGHYNTNFNLTLPASDADDTTNDEWKYDKVTFQITYGGRTYVAQEQIGAARGTANAFNVDFSNMPTGYVYNCKFTAHYQRTVVSYPFALYLTD